MENKKANTGNENTSTLQLLLNALMAQFEHEIEKRDKEIEELKEHAESLKATLHSDVKTPNSQNV